MSDAHLVPLPSDAILLHLGPFKTGTSAIQSSMAQARAEMAEHGVLYPGRGVQQRRPIWFVLGTKPTGRPVPDRGEWDRMREQVVRHPGRACVSSEDLGRAGPSSIQTLAAGLGADRLHTLGVLRPLDRMIPSMWQERVKTSDTIAYADYVEAILEGPGAHGRNHPAAAFWYQQDLAGVIERWSKEVPTERQTWLVTDPQDRMQLHRSFEQLLDLPAETLRLHEHANQSLSFNGAEAIRRLNALAPDRGWSRELVARTVKIGLPHGLRNAPRGPEDLPIPRLPSSFAPRLAELDAERLAALGESGVRVIGDPEGLRSETVADDHLRELPRSMSLDMVVEALAAQIDNTVRYHERMSQLERRAREHKAREHRARERRQPQDSPVARVDQAPARELLREVGRRGLRRLRRS